jgi:hypothetical protein
MQLELILIMRECGSQFAGAVNATAIDHHDDLFLCGAKDAHHWMDILTELVGIKVGHDFIENPGGAILHRTDDIEQDATGNATPATALLPGLAFETLLSVDLALTQGAHGEAVALASSPPAASGQGKAPQHGLILIEQDDLVLTRPILQGLQFESAIGQVGGVGIEPTGGTTVA